MLSIGYRDQKTFDEIKNICCESRHFIPIQRDSLSFLDNRDGSDDTGNDIVNGKCIWLAITAMECSSQQQKEVLRKGCEENGKIKAP